jgi:Rrf2 family protein
VNLSKTSSYALKVLNHLAENQDRSFSAMTLHGELGIPHDYLRTLLTKLSKSGFIRGTRGRNGGFRLARNPDKIFLADVIGAVESLEVLKTCIIGLEECPFDHRCALHDTWQDMRLRLISILRETSLDKFKK